MGMPRRKHVEEDWEKQEGMGRESKRGKREENMIETGRKGKGKE